MSQVEWRSTKRLVPRNVRISRRVIDRHEKTRATSASSLLIQRRHRRGSAAPALRRRSPQISQRAGRDRGLPVVEPTFTRVHDHLAPSPPQVDGAKTLDEAETIGTPPSLKSWPAAGEDHCSLSRTAIKDRRSRLQAEEGCSKAARDPVVQWPIQHDRNRHRLTCPAPRGRGARGIRLGVLSTTGCFRARL